MRGPLLAAALFLALSGCNAAVDPAALQVDSYRTTTSLDRYEDDGYRLRISCEGSPLHVLTVSVQGFPDDSFERGRWLLDWSDDSETVVVYAEDRAIASGRQADLYACSTTSPRIVEVTLRDAEGRTVAWAKVVAAPQST